MRTAGASPRKKQRWFSSGAFSSRRILTFFCFLFFILALILGLEPSHRRGVVLALKVQTFDGGSSFLSFFVDNKSSAIAGVSP